MKTTCKVLVLLFAVCGAANAQVAPAVTGPGGLPMGKNVQYAIRYSESGVVATSLATVQGATASGSLNFISGSERFPSIVDYGGGYTWSISGPAYGTGQFQRLYLSQGVVGRTWRIEVDDDASYLPEAPTTGFSGVAGTGEPIGAPDPAPTSSQSILTLNTHVIENIADGTLVHNLNKATTITLGGNSGLLRYPDGNGLDTNSVTGTGGIAREFNGRNTLLGNYLYTRFSYPGSSIAIETNTGLFGYQHKWSRNLESSIAGGPQWVSSTDASVVPTSTNVAVDASIAYVKRFTTASVVYIRGTSGGGGYLTGAELNSVAGNFSRQFGQNLMIGMTGGYDRTSGLSNNGVTDGKFGAAQATWRIGRTIILFANYTGTDQGSTSPLPTNVQNQLVHVFGFGVGYSPRSKHIGQ